MWRHDSSLCDFILCWWKDGAPTYGTAIFSFSKKLQYVKRQLRTWNRQCFGNIHSIKRLSQEHLNVITRKIRDQGFLDELGKAESLASRVLEEWELQEEIFWKKKARFE